MVSKSIFTTHHLRLAIGLSVLFVAVIVQPFTQGQGTVPGVPSSEQSPLDKPIALLTEAKRNYTAVKDYKCWLVSQERVKGVLLEKNIIDFKMKNEPFSVYMRWVEPAKFKGQEVAYTHGKNNGMMRVKSNFIGAKVIGFMNIAPNDARVMQHSRHTILEAGIGNMIEQNLRHWETARKAGKSSVTIADFKYDNRDCIRLEVAALDRAAATYCYRSVIYLEKDSKIPIRIENYDWPRQDGTPGGDLIESFSYVNLQFNTGLKDAEFDK